MFNDQLDNRYTLAEPRGWNPSTSPDERLDRISDATIMGDGADLEHPLTSDRALGMHARLMSYYQQELFIQAEQRREMADDERFYDGDQWTDEDRATLERRGQVPLVYNVIAPAVNWLLGTQRRAQSSFKVLPRRKDGSKPAERKTALMKYVDDASSAAMHVSRAFTDGVRVGIGWLEEGHQADEDGEPVFRRYESWRNIIWDSRAIEMDLSDARFLFRAKWVDVDIAHAMFGDPVARAHIDAAAADSLDLGMGDSDPTTYSDAAMDEMERALSQGTVGIVHNAAPRRRVRLIEAWYRTPEVTEVLKGGEFSGEQFDPWSVGHITSVSSGFASVVRRPKMRVRVAILTHKGMLYDEPSPYRHGRYPFTPIWGNRRGSDGMPYGLVRGMKDIQTDINKRASKALHILSTSKVIMDKGAVDDLDELAEEVARPDGVIEKKKGHELRIDIDRSLAAPHMDLMSRSIDMIQQQSGITDEAMGRTTNASSGKAILARQNQGSVAIAHYLDNLRFAVKASGEKTLSLIEQFFDEEKRFRITNSRGSPEYVAINDALPENDITRTKADFLIDESDWKSTMRQAQTEELMALLQQLAPAAPNIVMVVLDLVVEMMDVPAREEIVARIRKITGMEDPDADPEEITPEQQARLQDEALQSQMAQRAAEAEVSLTEASVAEKQARALKAGADADRARVAAVHDRLGNVEKSMQVAMELLERIAAAPMADRLHNTAKAGGLPPPPPTGGMAGPPMDAAAPRQLPQLPPAGPEPAIPPVPQQA